jgi:hypothetical protein
MAMQPSMDDVAFICTHRALSGHDEGETATVFSATFATAPVSEIKRGERRSAASFVLAPRTCPTLV